MRCLDRLGYWSAASWSSSIREEERWATHPSMSLALRQAIGSVTRTQYN